MFGAIRMDKKAERTAIDKVFGDYASNGEDSERPDFVISHETFVHGIEVTELYPSQADAKLQNVRSYTTGLLDGSERIHRADRSLLRVDTVSLLHEDGRRVEDVKAIIQTHPTAVDKLDILLRTIHEKASKYGSYMERADVVDLIVWDRSSLFGGKGDFEAIAAASRDSRKGLLQCPFREIYLLTRSPEPSSFFYYPVRASLFLADAILVDHVNLEGGTDVEDPLRLPTLAVCLARLGHTVSYEAGPEECIHTPGWQMLIEGLNINLRDWTTLGIRQPHGCQEALTRLVGKEHVDLLLAAREEIHCTNVVTLPAHPT